MAGYALVEFDMQGRTYRIKATGIGGHVTFSPGFFVNQVRDSVGQYEDLVTGGIITVNWQQVGVVRILQTSQTD